MCQLHIARFPYGLLTRVKSQPQGLFGTLALAKPFKKEQIHMDSHLSTPSRKSLDRRAKRTRQAIKESFVALTRTRRIEDVTVKEIMERADVNRATFYAHFSNIDDLERAIEADAAQHLIETVDRMRTSPSCTDDELTLVFGCLLGDRDVCRWLVGPQSLGCGKEILAEHSRQRCVPLWTARGKLTHAQAECLFDFTFGGAFGVLARWYEQDADAARTMSILSGIVSSTLGYAYAEAGA